MVAVGYVRVSTAEQAAGGLSLEAQRSAIETACRHRRWEPSAVFQDAGLSARTNYRPGLNAAMAACGGHARAVLVVASRQWPGLKRTLLAAGHLHWRRPVERR